MGFKVESYSLNELHRIVVPGAVAPSLFWALPVGRWNHQEVEEVWRLFTDSLGVCNDYGLLLVKKKGQRGSEATNVSLASVGAKLSDLLPSGAERFIHPSHRRHEESAKMLVLSGGYPQPGWGVLVEWQGRSVRQFEQLISQTIRHLAGSELKVFKDTAEAFHRKRHLHRPSTPDLSRLEREINAVQRIDTLLREAHEALQASEHLVVGEKIVAAVQAMKQATWLSITEDTLQALKEAGLKLTSAASLRALPEETFATEIAPHLEDLFVNPSKRQNAFSRLADKAQKEALKACLHLHSDNIFQGTAGFYDWADHTLSDVPTSIEANLSEVSRSIEEKLLYHRGLKAQSERDHQEGMKTWRQNAKEANEAYHSSAAKAAELQWARGPEFLVAFEQACRDEGIETANIPWDPARMVGWKIMASGLKVNVGDLQIAAREMAPDATGANVSNITPTGVADGSYFTDYVHHIAISKPGFSPRTVMRDLLVRLLRPGEMINLIEAKTSAASTEPDASKLAEQLLHVLGWHRSDEHHTKPLAGCIKFDSANTASIAGNLSGNDLRKAAESLCKDIVDIVVSQLGYRNDDVWNDIEQRIPAYRPSSVSKNWDEEVRDMTLGPAEIILAELAPLAFPVQAKDVSEFVSALGRLKNLLNLDSHDNSEKPIPPDLTDQAAALVACLLRKAEAFLGDLPWHMEASFVYGDQPKVLSGEAWSHGSPTPRLLRVIVWTGASPGSKVTFWNKERRNPVVPDPVFITRPRRHK